MDTAAARTGREGYLKAAMLCAFIVMKCEDFSQISDLVEYLENNRLIAYYCGFDINLVIFSYGSIGSSTKPVSSYCLKPH